MKFISGSLRAKIMAMAGLLVMTSVLALVILSTMYYIADFKAFTQLKSSGSSDVLAKAFNDNVSQVVERAKIHAANYFQQREKYVLDDRYISHMIVTSSEGMLESKISSHSEELNDLEFPTNYTTALQDGNVSFVQKNIQSTAYFMIGLPLGMDGDKKITKGLFVFVPRDALMSAFRGDGDSQITLFQENGTLLYKSKLSSNEDLIEGAMLPENFVKSVQGPMSNGVYDVVGQNGKKLSGSYYKTGISDVSVGVFYPYAKIYDTPIKILVFAGGIAIIILTLAFAVAFFLSSSLVHPIHVLQEATEQIALGFFDTHVTPTTKDEIAHLGNAFNSMTLGLRERERMKVIFGKFHSKAITEKMMTEGEPKLGGVRLPVTVFFSDIRGFTTLSENLTAEDVVVMINEYFTEMVKIIQKYGGEVDKYVGDAIMAIWGIPYATDPAMSALKASMACLEMRERLHELNVARLERGQLEIKIGMGINSGEVIFGNMGSESRMEITVIGDTVNTSSRIESMTKELKTDLLFSESTVDLLPKEAFDLGEAVSHYAKGKAEKVTVYPCLGLKVAKQSLLSVIEIERLKAMVTEVPELEAHNQEDENHESTNVSDIGSDGFDEASDKPTLGSFAEGMVLDDTLSTKPGPLVVAEKTQIISVASVDEPSVSMDTDNNKKKAA